MNELEIFQELKKEILLQYKKHFPFFTGNWNTFGTKEIANFIELIEKNQKQNISEKWIYTHLKSEKNHKLPRKGMLDIMANFVGKFDYDEWKFQFQQHEKSKEDRIKRKDFWKYTVLFLLTFSMIYFGWKLFENLKNNAKLNIKNQYTKEEIPKDELQVLEVKNKDTLLIENVQNQEEESKKIVIKSAFYKTKIIEISNKNPTKTVELEPEDDAMLLRNYLKSEPENWQQRKVKLNHILSENVEVLVMMKGNLGAEYFNKEEFVQKIIIPTQSTKLMKLVEIKKDEQNKINFIRLVQE